MKCRTGCGACCVALSISTPMPGMPHGKPAGVACIHLLDDMRCAIYDDPRRPACCAGLRPSEEMCGDSREAAILWMTALEKATCP